MSSQLPSAHASEWSVLAKRAKAEGWTRTVAAEWGRLRTMTGDGTLSMHEKHVARIDEVIAAPDLMSPPERRNLMLRNPDLAEGFAQPPLGLECPANWNGYLPPREAASGGVPTPNDSPTRAQIYFIVGEAIDREYTAKYRNSTAPL